MKNLLLCLALLLGTGCVQQTLSLSKPVVALVPQAPATHGVRNCVVSVVSVSDERHSKQDLGVAAGRNVMLGMGGTEKKVTDADAAKWFEEGFRGLRQSGYSVVLPDTPAPDLAGKKVVQARVAIKQLYVHSLTTSMSANIVATLQLVGQDGQPAAVQVMRGVETSVNWASGDSEIMTSFAAALQKVIEQMDNRFKDACGASA